MPLMGHVGTPRIDRAERRGIAALVALSLVAAVGIGQASAQDAEGAPPAEDTQAAPTTDRLLGNGETDIQPGEPGFLIERLAGEQRPIGLIGGAILPAPSVAALPADFMTDPTPAKAYAAFQRGYYLTAMDMALPLAGDGDAAAQTLVAELFSEGFAVPRDLEQAAFWYGQAAAGGDREAQFKYAMMLLAGRHTEADPERGRELMKQAADAGHPMASFNYGQLLVDQQRGQAGLIAAMPYFERSAAAGVADAQYALSQIYMNARDLDEAQRDTARDWLARAAASGFDTAQLDLAIWLIDGIGGDVDYEEGFRWMQIAANRGNVVAQNRLAHLYINAIGTRPDPVAAGRWYVLSRRAGYNDPVLDDFFRGLTDEEQRQAIEAANRFLG